jgi:chemotaxis protein methyltransferase WspC
MNLAPVIDLLRQRLGLDPESLGPSALPRAIATRMQALRQLEPLAYAALLAADPLELQLLISDVAVPETWFFRGGEVFSYLAQFVAAVASTRPGARCRILSVPCSTGEEPYSLAIALIEGGVLPIAWEIQAVDLSTAHVQRAQRARFSEFSFRQTTPERRQRYFRLVDGGWELAEDIRSLVHFRQGNLLEPFFLAGEGAYDLILCRNLFIYLHAAARRQALDTLDRLLASDGWICMGHAEPLEFLDPRFTRAGPAGFSLYRKAVRREDPWPVLSQSLPHAAPPPILARSAILESPHQSSPATPSSPVDLLAHARHQADNGQLDDAMTACQTHLAHSGPSAELFSLMGVIHQARREGDEAVRCYQNALYLEPGHRDALTHLMLLRQEQGDHVQAERLRRRLERVAPGGEA